MSSNPSPAEYFYQPAWSMPLACQRCYNRKVKCERQRPCTRCQKTGSTCVPRVRHHRPRATRPTKATDLGERIGKLETLILNMVGDERALPSVEIEQTTPNGSASKKDPHLIADKYVGGALWTSLATEVQALKEVLLDESSDEEMENDADLPSSSGSYGDTVDHDFILAAPNSIFVAAGALSTPSDQEQRALFNVFSENVDPVLKIFHIPSLRSFVLQGWPYLGQSASGRSCQALKAVLWFAAINTMSQHECHETLRTSHTTALTQAKRATDVALSQANVLGFPNIATLQALALYVATARLSDASCRPWSLLAIAIRAAKDMGLHRATTGRTFFETQIRRRLWHQIRALDNFCAADRGSQPMIPTTATDCPLPANINDEDFDEHSPEVKEHDKSTVTEMSFLHLIYDAVSVTHKLRNSDCLTKSWETRLKTVEEFDHRIHKLFLQHCDPSKPFHRLIHGVAKATSAALKLRAVRPDHDHVEAASQRADNPDVLRIAVDCLRASEEVYQDHETRQWRWMVWTQWQSLAVALTALCTIRDTAVASEAWVYVEAAFDRCRRHVADSEGGMLWKPISKLYGQAVAFRDGAGGVSMQLGQMSFSNYMTVEDGAAAGFYDAISSWDGMNGIEQEWLSTVDVRDI